jgi:hypothetical protein
MRKLPQAPFIRTSLVALVITTVLLLTSLVRAIRITPVEAAPAASSAVLLRVSSPPPPPEIDFDAVGANGIFQPDRTALPYRYRMPGEPGPDNTMAPEAPKPVVLGTVIATDGNHFATVQMPSGKPTSLRVKDQIGEYTVVAIDRDKVAFKNAAGQLIEITTTRPGGRP